jgi:hypothetical protein
MANGHEPATKQGIQRVEQDIHMLRSEFNHAFDELNETMRDVQTELLKALYAHAQSTDAKLKESGIADMLLRQRLTAVEFRITEVEERLNLPAQTQ